MTPDVHVLLARARAWLEEDPDRVTRAELEQVMAEVDAGGDPADLADRFRGTLEFGTAGLRGALGAGPNRMNRVVVLRAAAGLAAYLRQEVLPDRPGTGSVVIGYDARHNSDVFARDTAAVMTGAGLTAWVMPRPLPTPVLAFAIRELGCVAGVMVTASHNPPQDNGYKVYLSDGAQVVPPVDQEVEAATAAVGRLRDLPLSDGWEVLGEDVVDHYLDAVAALPRTPHRDVAVAYTPMHGVGGEVLLEAFRRAGFPAPAVVAEQAEPDADFPTVSFPNPEEPGAMDRLLALAETSRADVAIASDPDADRVAVAVGGRPLRGDEVGVLLADHLLSTGVRGRVATTVVSSSMLARVAAAHGVPCSVTLTGFKWLARAGRPEHRDLVYAYEEALGVMVAPDVVRDKDGISAALLVADLAAAEKARGRTLLDRLADLERQHGRHDTRQLSYRVADLSLITAAVEDVLRDPPAAYGALAVTAVEQPAPDVLVHRLGTAGRVVVRPSGTEPKLKAYLELVDADAAAMDALVAAVDARLGLPR